MVELAIRLLHCALLAGDNNRVDQEGYIVYSAVEQVQSGIRTAPANTERAKDADSTPPIIS